MIFINQFLFGIYMYLWYLSTALLCCSHSLVNIDQKCCQSVCIAVTH